jgi:long-chain acyl-CoA synthetase
MTDSMQVAVRRAAAEFGARPAFRLGDRTKTFTETLDRTLRLADALEHLGCHVGARVAIMASNGPWFAEVHFACAEAGMVEVPVNLRFTADELVAYLGRVQPEVVIASAEHVGRARELQAAVPSLRAVIGLGDAAGAADHDYNTLLAHASAHERPIRDVSETVLVCSTSGTSGAAKAVTHTPRATATGYGPLIELLEVDPSSHFVTGLPMYFAGAYSGWTMSFVAGAMQTILPAFDPHAYVDLVEAVGASHALLGPAPVYMIMDAGIDLDRMTSLRYLSMGGAPTDPTRLRALVDALGRRVAVQYAMTEVAVATALLADDYVEPDGSFNSRHRSIGRPLDGLEIRIVDDQGVVLPFDGEARGELELVGPYVTPGYLDDPAANEAAFEGRWLRTGDVATIDADRFVWIVDRKKDLIVSGGINIAPIEVETVIAQHPDVVAAGVCGVPDPLYGEAVHAAVVRRPGSQLSEEEVVRWCTERLASVKKPRSVVFVEALPISSTGKLLRRELRTSTTAESSPPG